MKMNNLQKVIQGTAIGDTIGLPMEGMKPSKITKLKWTAPLRQRLLFGRGMWSDDTEHTLHLIDALTLSDGDPARFRKVFSGRLQFWLSTLPPGVGLATLRSIIKQMLGFHNTGIFSAGNGPAMRAAILGALFPTDHQQRHSFNRIHTELTHSDPKALEASELVVDIAAAFTRGETTPDLNEMVQVHSEEWVNLIKTATDCAQNSVSLNEALTQLNIRPEKGVSGYSYHTVPALVYIGLRNNWDFEKTLTELISLGGDTDSTAAIAGALCALYPNASIPSDWSNQIREFPQSFAKVSEKAHLLSNGTKIRMINPFLWPVYLARNLTQFVIVIGHILMRLLPSPIIRIFIR